MKIQDDRTCPCGDRLARDTCLRARGHYCDGTMAVGVRRSDSLPLAGSASWRGEAARHGIRWHEDLAAGGALTPPAFA